MAILQSIDAALSQESWERNNKKNRQRRNRPESGRQARASFDVGAALAPSDDFDIQAANLFGTTLVFNLGIEGVIFETGGDSEGALVAVYNDTLIVRCGNGSAVLHPRTARIAVPLTELPRGKLARLAWLFVPSATVPIRAKAWVNGDLIGDSEASLDQDSWTGTGSGGFNNPVAPLAVEADEVAQAYTAGGGVITKPLFNYEIEV